MTETATIMHAGPQIGGLILNDGRDDGCNMPAFYFHVPQFGQRWGPDNFTDLNGDRLEPVHVSVRGRVVDAIPCGSCEGLFLPQEILEIVQAFLAERARERNEVQELKRIKKPGGWVEIKHPGGRTEILAPGEKDPYA